MTVNTSTLTSKNLPAAIDSARCSFGMEPTSSLVVDFKNGVPRCQEQFGQFRLSNRTTEVFGRKRFFITEIGPGLFPGERHQISLSLGDKSNVVIESQSATKVHLCEDDRYAKMKQNFKIASDCSLIALLAPTISYEGSNFVSSIQLDLALGGVAITSEIIAKVAPTKNSHGTTTIDMAMEVIYGGETVLIDRIATHENPLFDPLGARQRITGGFDVIGTIYFCGFGPQGDLKLHELTKIGTSAMTKVQSSLATSPMEQITLIRGRARDPFYLASYFSWLAQNFLN
ncbi:urease accessory protein UreD [Acidithrix sp. C25]|uniref:urease accessory protein UreD n=1 Tax=Acidithrix sp. C25 TaxID=1671482 RepID=UPI00191B9693|nr:urease accessory protein UreD [Acidithrix sp. C25]CAG4932172.1 unnamed protein product [Acidithrix sp. C25]